MFEFNLQHLGALIIGLSVVLRPYLLNKIGHNNAFGNTIYFGSLMLVITPMYMYKLTFSSLDDDSAKEMVEKVLTFEPFSDYVKPSNIIWKPYNGAENLYNMQADVTYKTRVYRLYLQPECHFFKGCEVTIDRIMLVPKESIDFDITELTTERFDKRPCSDVLVETLLKQEKLPGAIKVFFEQMAAKADSKTHYAIQSVSIHDFKELNTPYKAEIDSNITQRNSCEARFEMRGNFSVIHNKDGKEYALPILQTIFDEVTGKGTSLTISSNVQYGIYTTPQKEIMIAAQPFNFKKFAKIKELNNKSQKQEMVKKKKPKTSDTQTKLHLAVQQQNFDEVKKLIASGHDVDERGVVGYTPLMRAAGLENFDIVRLLVEHGADINAKIRSGWSVLHRAAMSKNPDILKYLIAKGIKMNVKDRYGCDPVNSALSYNALQTGGSLENTKILIKHGMSINNKCRSYTPLMISVPEYEVSKFLVDNGADKSLRNQFKETAYDMAKKQHVSKVYLQLLKP